MDRHLIMSGFTCYRGAHAQQESTTTTLAENFELSWENNLLPRRACFVHQFMSRPRGRRLEPSEGL
jgi:hypothetical protein